MNESYGKDLSILISFVNLPMSYSSLISAANIYFSRYKHTEDQEVRFSTPYNYGLYECFM